MERNAPFDEVMIVNPHDPATGRGEGVILMPAQLGPAPGFGYYADPYGYYADPYGFYADPYAQPDPGMGLYVSETDPAFNAGCPMPTNVHGVDEDPTLGAYIRPENVNAACERFVPQPGTPPGLPETLRPLW